MATLESNLDEIDQWIKKVVDQVDFTRPGKEGSLGSDLAGIVAEEINVRTVGNEQSADGSPLKENEPKYRARKLKKYSVDQPLVRTGQMTSIDSLLGEVTITHDEVSIRYGKDKPPDSGSTGVITDQDRAVTDRQKAEWNSDDRPFFGLDERIADECAGHSAEWIADQDFS